MRERHRPLDRVTLALVVNGDIPAWKTQEFYERVISEGICPLDEGSLKLCKWLRKGHKRKRGSA